MPRTWAPLGSGVAHAGPLSHSSIAPPPRRLTHSLACCAAAPKILNPALSGLAALTSFIGVIVVSTGDKGAVAALKTYQDNLAASKLLYGDSFTGSITMGQGYGCAIAACIIQFISFALTLVPAAAPAAPVLKSETPAIASAAV